MASSRLLWWVPIAALVVACGSDASGPGASGGAATPTSVPAATTTTGAPTTAPAPTDERAPIVRWLQEQQAAGLDQVFVDPWWSAQDAALVIAFTQVPTVRGELVVALADGRTAPLPTGMTSLLPATPTGAPNIRITHLDGDPLAVMVAPDGRTVVAARLDTERLAWTAVARVASLGPGERLDLYRAGDVTLFVHWTDMGTQWGEIVHPDGTVTRMADAPADTPIWFTNAGGGRALLLGLDTVAEPADDLPAPVAFDPVTNEWLRIPTPDWVRCSGAGDGCWWGDRHEYADPQFFRTTPAGVVARLPDGSYGVLDPVALTWRRVDDPPIALPGPIVAAVGDDRLLALPGPPYEGPQSLGVAAWLDLGTGTWTTEQVADMTGWATPVWWEPRWWGDVMLLGADRDEVGNPPIVAIDLTTGEVRPPTVDELAAWPALDHQVPIDALITTLDALDP